MKEDRKDEVRTNLSPKKAVAGSRPASERAASASKSKGGLLASVPFLAKRKFYKRAKQLSKGVKRWLNYKQDLLTSDQLSTVRRLHEDLKVAIKGKDEEGIDKASRLLNDTCTDAVPAVKDAAVAENAEVIFVALVVVFGFKAFFLKPFRIPTGSMQPALNGIITTPVAEWGEEATLWNEEDTEVIDRPGFPKRVVDRVLYGTRYLDIVAKNDATIVPQRGVGQWGESNLANLISSTKANLSDGTSIKVPLPRQAAFNRTGFDLEREFRDGKIKKGEVIARGRVRAGDYVVVDRFSYHFRRPKRGEVFVFSTRDISGITLVDREMGSIHYIKRLAGVPGDEIEVRPLENPAEARKRYNERMNIVGDLYINGELAKEEGFQKVMSRKDLNRGYGADVRFPKVTLGEKQYWAMGDNSHNSADSRTWGVVPERNLAGPGMLVLWPLGPHWGRIK